MFDGDLAAVHEVHDEAEVGVADAAEEEKDTSTWGISFVDFNLGVPSLYLTCYADTGKDTPAHAKAGRKRNNPIKST